MRKLILSIMVSLDGMIARPDGDLEWFLTDEGFESEMLDLLRNVDGMLFGRKSYELLAGYWPTAGTSASAEAPGGFTSQERQVEFARLMNTTPKIVFSRTLEQADWGPATLVREVDPDEIAKLKQQPGKDLVLFAGASLASEFLKLDLLDEYRLMVHPIVLGQGIPLVQGLTQERKLRLVRAKTCASGVVTLQYERDHGG